MKIPNQTPEKARQFLADAARWRFESLLFQLPGLQRQLEIESLAREIGDPRLSAWVDKVAAFPEGEYLALLGPGGKLSPREAGYRPLSDPGQVLADLGAFYSAFAYTPGSENPDDHISSELGFLGFLRLKQAYAMMSGLESERRLVAEAIDRFVEDHLSEFAEGLARKLSEKGPEWLAQAAEQISQRIRWLRGVVPLSTRDTSIPARD